MKIVFTFEWDSLQTRAAEWFNTLSFLGHEVYLLNPSDYTKRWCAVFGTKVNFITDDNFIDGCDVWFFDMSPVVWDKGPRLVDKMRAFKGRLVCINFEDGYDIFELLIDKELRDKTTMFIGNAFFYPRTGRYGSVKDKLFLTTSYITNSQAFRRVALPPIVNRKKRVYFSGALTGFPSSLTEHDVVRHRDEYKLRYNLCKLISDSGIDHLFRFTGFDPNLKTYYDEMDPTWKMTHVPQDQYRQEFTNSLFCLAVKGNSFPTNRFYESQAAGCVTLTNRLHVDAEFYGTGVAGKDYVEIDINNEKKILDVIRYYSEHLDEAQQIAENGRKNWETYTMLDDNGVWSPATLKYHLDGVKALSGWDMTKV